jgi:hypothetical protein
VTFRLAVHWTVVLISAATVCVVAPLPFTGRIAGAAGVVAAVAVLAIGYATTPTRKDGNA